MATNNKFQSTAQPVQPPPPYSDRQFLHTYAAGAFLPLAQASITAVLMMLATGLLLYMFDVMDFGRYAVIVGVLVWVFTWLYQLRRWINLTTLETIFGVELDGNPGIGEQPKQETVIRLDEVKDNSHFQSHTYKLPISEEQLIMFADGLINRGRPLSRREWTPKENGFSDDEYRELQRTMARFQLLEAHGAGCRLTRPGAAMMRYYAKLSPTPPVEPVEE